MPGVELHIYGMPRTQRRYGSFHVLRPDASCWNAGADGSAELEPFRIAGTLAPAGASSSAIEGAAFDVIDGVLGSIASGLIRAALILINSASVSHAISPGDVLIIRPTMASGTSRLASVRAITVVIANEFGVSYPPPIALWMPILAPGNKTFCWLAANRTKHLDAPVAVWLTNVPVLVCLMVAVGPRRRERMLGGLENSS